MLHWRVATATRALTRVVKGAQIDALTHSAPPTRPSAPSARQRNLMKRWMKWLVVALVAVLIGALALRNVKQRRSAAAAAAAPASAPAAIDIGAADVVPARRVELINTLAISGGLKAVNSAVVKSRVAAELKSLSVREGDVVRAGQIIGQLDDTEFALRVRQAEQTALSARTQLDIARRTLENNRALVAQGFISPTGLETSVSNEAGAQASFQAARAAADLALKARADAVLTAPIGGIVAQRFVQPGERVPIDARLVEIVDLRQLELEVAVPPEDVGAVQVGQLARLDIDGLSAPAAARVVRIAPSTQAGTRAVMVYLAVTPQPGLRQGLFGRGAIDLQRRTTLVVPVALVRIDQALPYVLAVVDGRVVRRTVQLGARGEARLETSAGAASTPERSVERAVEITGGIEEGALLLRASVGSLRDGTRVRTVQSVTQPAAAPSAASAPPTGAVTGSVALAPAASPTVAVR